ncbi:MAG: hypothetical protein ABWX71_06930, partial [Aeromicrobium sp.]
LRRLLVAAVCGGLVFAVSGYVLEAATMVTRVLIATAVTLLGYAGLALAKARPGGAPAGRRRAIAAAPVLAEPVVDESAEPSLVDADIAVTEVIEDAEVVEDAEPWLFAGEDVDPSFVDEYLEDAEVVEYAELSLVGQPPEDVEYADPSLVDVDAGLSFFDTDTEDVEYVEDADPSFADVDAQGIEYGEDVDPSLVDADAGLSLFDTDVAVVEDAEPSLVDEHTEVVEDDELPHAPVLFLEQLIRQAMAEELANAQAQDESEDEAPEDQALELAHAQAAGVALPDMVMHDLVPISSLIEARAEAERLSLQRIQATVRGLSVRTGDDPVAVDVLARVVAAVDRLMVTESFERPVLSETGPLLAAIASAPQADAPPAREATPLPAVPAMRPSDMPVTELTTNALSEAAIAEDLPEEAPEPETQPIDAVVVDDPDLVLPIPAPPRPQPAPRGRRLRRHSVA